MLLLMLDLYYSYTTCTTVGLYIAKPEETVCSQYRVKQGITVPHCETHLAGEDCYVMPEMWTLKRNRHSPNF